MRSLSLRNNHYSAIRFVRTSLCQHLRTQAYAATRNSRDRNRIYTYKRPSLYCERLSIWDTKLRHGIRLHRYARGPGPAGPSLQLNLRRHYCNGSVDRRVEYRVDREIELLCESEGFEIGTLKFWDTLVSRLEAKNGVAEIMEALGLIKSKGLLSLLAPSDANWLHTVFLNTALRNELWLGDFVDVAELLLDHHNFSWPNIYTEIIGWQLRHGKGDRAFYWHLRLNPKFRPQSEAIGSLLLRFLNNPAPDIQTALTSIYVHGSDHNFYDAIVSRLYARGSSKLARSWRKVCLPFGDLPVSATSKPFLRFLACYYPGIPLTDVERKVADIPDSANQSKQITNSPPRNPGQYSDSIVAKWFASSWTSVSFAIKLVSQLGIRAIGPRSLQALALRAASAKDLAGKLQELEELQITIPTQTYGISIAYLASQREDGLLRELLECDIHPDEFDDLETRNLLLQSAKQNGHNRRQLLLETVELALRSLPLRSMYSTVQPDDARNAGAVVDTPSNSEESPPISAPDIPQAAATSVLRSVFSRISTDSKHSLFTEGMQENIDLAIAAIFRMAHSNFAIPLKFWIRLLHALGRSGRLGDLERLSLKMIEVYRPPQHGLVPIYGLDLPGSSFHIIDAHGVRKAHIGNTHVAEVADYTSPTTNQTGTASVLSQHSDLHTAEDSLFDLNNSDVSLGAKFAKADEQTLRDTSDALTQLMKRMRKDDSVAPKPEKVKKPEKPESIADLFQKWELPSDKQGTIKNKPQLRKLFANQHQETRLNILSRFGYALSERELIPTDLPFSHRDHPMHKIFNSKIQRCIVRWGFDQAMRQAPPIASRGADGHSKSFDIMCGVRMLALLRDQGVLIDLQVLSATIVSRIAVSQIPGRRKHVTRDKSELSLQRMNDLIGQAWGSKLFQTAAELSAKVETQKIKLWNQYPKLYGSQQSLKRQEARIQYLGM